MSFSKTWLEKHLNTIYAIANRFPAANDNAGGDGKRAICNRWYW